MKLNKEEKQELRILFEEKLKKVPNGNKINLDEELKEIIQQLLFDEWHGLKIPTWSGDFLSKMDLSKISFEDVTWGIFTESNELFNYQTIDEEEYNNFIWPLVNSGKDYLVEYKNTNAQIKLEESWEYKNLGAIIIARTNFCGTDLSNNLIKKFNSWTSDFSKTGLKLPKYSKKTSVNCFRTNLEGIDLSSYKLNIVEDFICLSNFDACNLKNTGIKITTEDVEQALNEGKIGNVEVNEFHEAIKKGSYDGCYIDGVLIESNASQLKILSNRISENIEKQIKKMK